MECGAATSQHANPPSAPCPGLELARKCPHGDTLVEKQLHIVSYMFEVMADIMIEPKHNMSDSGSFEMFLMGKNQT